MSDVPKVPIRPLLEYYGAEYLPEGRRGWTPVKCCFHPDSRASASFSEELEAFNCMACGMKGDGLKIIMQKEQVDFPTASQRAGEIVAGYGDGSLSSGVVHTGRRKPLGLFDGGERLQPRDDQAVQARRRTRPRRIAG